MTRGYTTQQFYTDLKTVIQVAGVEGEEALLYLEDYQLTNPAILESENPLWTIIITEKYVTRLQSKFRGQRDRKVAKARKAQRE